MPNQLSIVLRDQLATAGAGVGLPIDIGDRTLVDLTVDAPLLGTGNVLAVSLETSATGSGWAFLGRFDNITAPTAKTFMAPTTLRFIRARWTLTGTAPLSATFSVTGTAHQLYCSPADVSRYGIPAAALDSVPLAQIAMSALAANDEAAGYLASAYTLPIVKWDSDLRKHVACMTAYDIIRQRGYDPDSGKDELLQRGHDNAIAWLNRIANGQLRPPGMVDSTPLVTEVEVYVASGPSRGWGWPPCR